jgi:hypothetical protein
VKSRTDKGVRNQVGLSLVEQVGQRLLPLVSGMAATKLGLLEWVHDFGLKALDELMRDDAARIVGAKGKHRRDRTHHYWGKTRSELTFGGRRISVDKPRVRSKDGREAALPVLEEFRDRDPLSERVMNQLLLGVSTRGYDASLEPRPSGVKARGSSKSARRAGLSWRRRGSGCLPLWSDGLTSWI